MSHGELERRFGQGLGLEALERLAPALVGVGHVWEAKDRLARAMLMEALRQTRGNFTHAARLLGVRRQAVQQMIVRFDLEAWSTTLRDFGEPRQAD